MLICKKLELIKSDTTLLNLLEEFCDFIICTTSVSSEEYLFYSKEPYTIFATDGSGGTFGFIGNNDKENLPIGYVSSEGESGKISDNIDQLLSLISFYPYFWIDLIRFYRENKNNGLHEYIVECENEIKEDNSHYCNIQTTITNKLSLKKNDKIMDNLIQSLSDTSNFIVYSIEDNNPSKHLL